MAFSKYYYEQYRKELKQENKKYEAHNEKKELSTKRCKHKSTKIERNMLICDNCGAFWQGAGIDKLQRMLK